MRKPEPAATAAAYIRVSTEEQARDGLSLDAQEETARAYCALRGLELAEVVRDPGVSGARELAARPGGRLLLSLVRRQRVHAVVAWKLDRLFRDCADCLTVVRGWDRAAVALHLVDLGGQAVDVSSAIGRFFLTVMAGAAELERNQNSERVAHALRLKAERGEFTGGAVPYGFRLDAGGARLIPVPDEQRVIAAARELAASGLSLRGVARELERCGLLSRAGRPFRHPQVRRMLAEVA